jgi:hypothetical protein
VRPKYIQNCMCSSLLYFSFSWEFVRMIFLRLYVFLVPTHMLLCHILSVHIGRSCVSVEVEYHNDALLNHGQVTNRTTILDCSAQRDIASLHMFLLLMYPVKRCTRILSYIFCFVPAEIKDNILEAWKLDLFFMSICGGHPPPRHLLLQVSLSCLLYIHRALILVLIRYAQSPILSIYAIW